MCEKAVRTRRAPLGAQFLERCGAYLNPTLSTASKRKAVMVGYRVLRPSGGDKSRLGRTDRFHNQCHSIGGFDSYFSPLGCCPMVGFEARFP